MSVHVHIHPGAATGSDLREAAVEHERTCKRSTDASATTISAVEDRLRWLRRFDRLGIWLSALCIVHCALTPVLILALPLFASHGFDSAARIFLSALGVLGVGFGTALHRNYRALPFLGLALLLFGALSLFELVTGEHLSAAWELGLGIPASFALMTAHALNTRACSSSAHDCAPARWTADHLWPENHQRSPDQRC